MYFCFEKILSRVIISIFIHLLIADINATNISDSGKEFSWRGIERIQFHNKQKWGGAKSILLRIDKRGLNPNNCNNYGFANITFFKTLKKKLKNGIEGIEIYSKTDGLDYYPDLIFEVNFDKLKKDVEKGDGGKIEVQISIAAFFKNTDEMIFFMENYEGFNTLSSNSFHTRVIDRFGEVHKSNEDIVSKMIEKIAKDFSKYLIKIKAENYNTSSYKSIPITREPVVRIILSNGEVAKGYFLGEDDEFLYYKQKDASPKIPLRKSVITNYEIIKN